MTIRDRAASESRLPERGEFIVRGGYVVTMDDVLGDLDRADVHVRDGEIVAVGEVDAGPAIESIDASGQLVMPGLVDSHWHLWNSLFRGVIGDGERSYFPVKNRLAPLLTAEDTYASASLGLSEAVAAGITTLNDWDHNARSPEHVDAHAQAIVDSGLRARYSYGNPDKLDPAMVMDLEDIKRFETEWIGSASDGRLLLGMAMRGPIRTERDVCLQEWAFARDHGMPMTMHCGGRREESGRYCEIAEMAHLGLLGPDLQMVHAVHSTPDEIELLAQSGTHISLSPLTELRSMGVPPTGSFLAAGIPLSLSIDTVALPTVADMFLQMNVTLSVEMARDPATTLTPRAVLELATIAGARELGMDRHIGSLTPGKRADLICVRLDSLNMAPAADPVRVMVYCARPSDVTVVVADGRVLKRDGRLTTIDPESVSRAASQALAGLVERSGWDVRLGVAADAVVAG